MNFYEFEKSNLGYHFTAKDILIGDLWIKNHLIVEINDIRVFFWMQQYEEATYKIDVELTMFGGESKTVVLYCEPKTIENVQAYFNSIFTKIKI